MCQSHLDSCRDHAHPRAHEQNGMPRSGLQHVFEHQKGGRQDANVFSFSGCKVAFHKKIMYGGGTKEDGRRKKEEGCAFWPMELISAATCKYLSSPTPWVEYVYVFMKKSTRREGVMFDAILYLLSPYCQK